MAIQSSFDSTDQAPRSVHYRRDEPITPAKGLDSALDVIGIKVTDLWLIPPLFMLVAFIVGYVVGLSI